MGGGLRFLIYLFVSQIEIYRSRPTEFHICEATICAILYFYASLLLKKFFRVLINAYPARSAGVIF